MSTDKFDRVLERAERVMRQLDQRDGAVREIARRERKRSIQRYSRAARQAVLAVLAVSIATIVVGMITPIGLFGFLAAVMLAVGVAGLLFFWEAREETARTSVPKDVPNGEMVQRFESYLYHTRRSLPPPAQTELNAIITALPSLKQTLERIDELNPEAQDARRLMSVHLPGLIDRYVNVPPAYRSHKDGEDVTVDERLREGLAAGRGALEEITEKLARSDVAALETQGRFIKSRYGQERVEG